MGIGNFLGITALTFPYIAPFPRYLQETADYVIAKNSS